MRATPGDLDRWTLFTAFLRIGALGFGGVAPWARHVLVVERRWLDEAEYAELFGLCSALPGANTIKFAVIFSDRHAGVGGVLAALFGLLGAPLAILVAVASLYTRFASVADVQAAMAGVAAGAAGLVGGTALRMVRGLVPTAGMAGMVLGVFVAVGIVRLPIAVVLGCAIPLCIIAAATRGRRT